MFHRLSVMGYLGSDATVRNVNNDEFVVNFNVADSREFVDKTTGEEIKKTQWFTCSYWFKAEPKLAQYLKKGTLVYVEGSVSTDVYIDKADKTQAQIKIKVFELRLLKSPTEKKETNSSSEFEQVF
jgi:single-strand DNA-binding protein